MRHSSAAEVNVGAAMDYNSAVQKLRCVERVGVCQTVLQSDYV